MTRHHSETARLKRSRLPGTPLSKPLTLEEKIQSLDNFLALCVGGQHMTCQEAIEYRDRHIAKYQAEQEAN